MIECKQIIINDLLINYYFLGEEDNKKNIIFLHGWRSESSVWFDIMKSLSKAEEYNLFAIDLPGFGKTQVPQHSLSIAGYAGIVLQFIEKLKVKGHIILIGHSFGGAVSIKFATDYQDTISQLVLIDSSGVRITNLSRKAGLQIKKLIAKLVKPFFKPRFMQPLRKQIYKRFVNSDYVESEYIKVTYINVISEDLSPLFPAIKCPTLLFWGEKDQDTPLWMGELMHEKINDSKLIILKDVGHYSFLEKKKEFIVALKEFIT